MVWVIFLISNRPLEDAVSRHIVLYYKKIRQLNQLENYHFLLDVISGVSGHRQLFGILLENIPALKTFMLAVFNKMSDRRYLSINFALVL